LSHFFWPIKIQQPLTFRLLPQVNLPPALAQKIRREHRTITIVKKVFLRSILTATAALTLTATYTQAQIALIAKGTLTSSRAGAYKDLSGLTYTLENGVAANLLGGLGSGITYMTGNTSGGPGSRAQCGSV
jgi:hypothetical protein